MEKILLVACDIEGCLTVNKRMPIDVGTIVKVQAYCELARRGRKPPFILCTGRPQPYAEHKIQDLDAFFPGFPSVVENGCFLYDPVNDIVIPHPLIAAKNDPDLVDVGIIRQFSRIKELLYEKIVLSKLGKFEPGKELCISMNPTLKGTVKDLFDKVQEALSSKYRRSVFITYSSAAVDITPIGVDKGSGMEFLSERVRIPWKNILGIGDSLGDLPFLEKVGFKACPSNAKQELIQYIQDSRNGYVSGKSSTQGVWDILVYHFALGVDGRG